MSHKNQWLLAAKNLILLLFLLTLPLSLRHTWRAFSPIDGRDIGFNEYLDISFYLSDLTIIVFLALSILCYKTITKSSYRSMFHVEHSWKAPLLGFLGWTLLTIFWSSNIWLAIFTFIKILEGVLLLLALQYVPRGTSSSLSQAQLFHVEQETQIKNVPRRTSLNSLVFKMFHVEHLEYIKRGSRLLKAAINKCSTWNNKQIILGSFLVGSLLESFIVIAQFLLQHSVGLYMLGESHFSPNLPGVAKIVVGDLLLSRPYGLFPHPNIAAAYVGLGLLIIGLYPQVLPKKMFHVEQVAVSRALLIIQSLAFFLLFSKASWLSFTAAVFFWIFFSKRKQACSTWNIFKSHLFHVEHKWPLLLFAFAALFVLVLQINFHFFLTQPVLERIFYMKAMLNLPALAWVFGAGPGQFVYIMPNLSQALLDWQFQPIHNVYFLILSEGGMIALGLWVCFFVRLWKMVFSVPRGTANRALAITLLSYVAVLFLFDHFFWDIQQGICMLWLTLALAILLTENDVPRGTLT